MSQIKAYRNIGLCIAATLLCAVSCVIETDDDDDNGAGGTTSVVGGATSTNTAKVGGATAKGGATATGGKTGAGGATTAAAGSTTVGGTSAGVGGSSASTASAGNAGGPGASGSAGSSSSGVAGAAGATCIDSTALVTLSVCPGIPTQCNNGSSPAYEACIGAWATYAASVADEIQRCIAAIPATPDLCSTTQASLDACVKSTVSKVCPTSIGNATCTGFSGICSTLNVSACQTRVAADLGYDAVAFGTCYATSTASDCNAKILGCI